MTPLHKAYVILALAAFQLAAAFWIILRSDPPADSARRARQDRNLTIAAAAITAAIVTLLLEQ